MAYDTSSVLWRAFELAKQAHGSVGQRRKYSGEPYIVHPVAVAQILTRAGETDLEILAAALLHDVLEDVAPITLEAPYYNVTELIAAVGERVTALVIELTDEYTKNKYPELNRRERKHLEANRLGDISMSAMRIKLADIIHNTHDILDNDFDFGKIYVQEKEAILKQMAPRVAYNGDEVIRKLFAAASQFGTTVSLIV